MFVSIASFMAHAPHPKHVITSLHPSPAHASPVVLDGEDHPEEGHHHPLTPDLWHAMVTADGRITDPDRITQVRGGG